MPGRRRRLAATSAAAALAVSLGACSGGGAGRTDAADRSAKPTASHSAAAKVRHVLEAAARQTGEAKSARVSTTVHADRDAGRILGVEGVRGWSPLLTEVEIDGMPLGRGRRGHARALRVGDVVYLSADGLTVAGKRWLKYDYSDLAELVGPNAGEAERDLPRLGANPAAQMSMLLQAEDLEFAGEQRIDGSATRHYRGTLDLGTLLGDAEIPYLSPQTRARLAYAVEFDGGKGLAIDVWLGRNGLPVRIDVSHESEVAGRTTYSERISDYGIEVSPRAPSAGDTADVAKRTEEAAVAGG